MADDFISCSIEACNGNARPGKGGAMGYCAKHYWRFKKHSDPHFTLPRPHRRENTCSVDGCNDRVTNRGLCCKHYNRLRRHGDPLGGTPSRGHVWEWLVDHVGHKDDTACLTWPFARIWNGHGHFRRGGKDRLAHREMCRLAHGEPPTDIHEAAHSCGRAHEGCVNPHHLSWKTPKENHADKLIHGTHNRGARSGSAKLSALQVLQIRGLRGAATQKQIAQRFGVGVGAIQAILSGKTWVWL